MPTISEPPQWLAWLADIASIAGFVISILVLIVTSSLKRSFALRARTPELRKALTTIANKIPGLLKSWPQSRIEALGEFAKAKSHLKNLAAKLPRADRAEVTTLVRVLHGRRTGIFSVLTPISDYNDEDLWNAFTALQGIIAMLEQRERDALWE